MFAARLDSQCPEGYSGDGQQQPRNVFERWNMSASAPFLERIRAEYVEMPGLLLKGEQIERLCGVEHAACMMAHDALVESGFLSVSADGDYSRVTDGVDARPRAAKADLRTAPRVAKAS
jgi:hypothetical protein